MLRRSISRSSTRTAPSSPWWETVEHLFEVRPSIMRLCCILSASPVSPLLSASQGGEGEEGRSCDAADSWRWCVGRTWLLLGEILTATFSVAVILDRKSGLSNRRFGDQSTSKTEAPSQDSRRRNSPLRHQVVRPRRSDGGRRWSLLPGGEDLELDCSFCSFSKVLCVTFKGYAIFSFLCKAFVVKLYPPIY
jgi:hypothetical protein